VYAHLCKKQGIRFEKGETSLLVQGTLSPGEFYLPGDVSSQFVSGLLFALPGLPGDSVIRLRPPVESRSYIDMTMDALRRFGVETRWRDRETVAVPGRQYYKWQSDVRVEGDWSNAAPFLALGVGVTGLDPESRQGDRAVAAYLGALDAGRPTLDLADCPDLGPLLMACAAARHGAVFTGTRRLRWKESDRGAAMAEELGKFGVEVRFGADEIAVGCGLHPPAEPLCAHNDHRIVMALAVLCARTGGTITGAEAVNKSFPDFFEKLQRVGVRLTTDRE
jgi:3-phosphoshikimate 1-carboxyvinyltransferase